MDHNKNKLVKELIDREKWQDIISRFIDVLKINIFIVDCEGKVISPPMRERYGWTFFEKFCLRLRGPRRNANLLLKYQKNGDYAEFNCECGLYSFTIPINVENEESIAYLIIGPIALNKKEDSEFYKQVSEKLKLNYNDLMDTINEVRVVSYMTMKSILDLLSEVAKDVTELNLEKRKLNRMSGQQEVLPKKVSEVAEDIYTTIHLNEILITLLDLALKMTNTECGSIMVMDENKNELTIRVSRGIDEARIQGRSIKLGEGLAGLAAQDNSSFVIHGTDGDNRIKPLLKRPEIKHSVVMPLSTKKRVFGVLNLHTKSEKSKIEDGLNNLQYLKKLISAAFQSI